MGSYKKPSRKMTYDNVSKPQLYSLFTEYFFTDFMAFGAIVDKGLLFCCFVIRSFYNRAAV